MVQPKWLKDDYRETCAPQNSSKRCWKLNAKTHMRSLCRNANSTIILVALVCVFASIGKAQAPVTNSAQQAFSGTVKTPLGTFVPGATVQVTNQGSKQVWVSWTDEAGKFQFPALPAGNYLVEVSQLGFVKPSQEIPVSSASSAPIAIVLRVATLAELSAAPSAPEGRPGRSTGIADKGSPTGSGGSNRENNAGMGGGGRGQLPPGVLNAMRQGLVSGFQQTDLTEDSGGAGQGSQNAGYANESAQTPASIPSTRATSDSFLLQGTVGQGLSPSGPGGAPGEFGPGGLAPASPGTSGASGGGQGRFGQGGGFPGFGGQGGGPGGGGFGGRGRMARQSVNQF